MLFSALVMRCLQKIDLGYENGTQLQVTIIRITESKENKSIQTVLMCLAQQVQRGQLTRCLPASYGSGAVATDGPFCLTPVLCGLPFFSLKTKNIRLSLIVFAKKC